MSAPSDRALVPVDEFHPALHGPTLADHLVTDLDLEDHVGTAGGPGRYDEPVDGYAATVVAVGRWETGGLLEPSVAGVGRARVGQHAREYSEDSEGPATVHERRRRPQRRGPSDRGRLSHDGSSLYCGRNRMAVRMCGSSAIDHHDLTATARSGQSLACGHS